jgi:hypothetical protein
MYSSVSSPSIRLFIDIACLIICLIIRISCSTTKSSQKIPSHNHVARADHTSNTILTCEVSRNWAYSLSTPPAYPYLSLGHAQKQLVRTPLAFGFVSSSLIRCHFPSKVIREGPRRYLGLRTSLTPCVLPPGVFFRLLPFSRPVPYHIQI